MTIILCHQTGGTTSPDVSISTDPCCVLWLARCVLTSTETYRSPLSTELDIPGSGEGADSGGEDDDDDGPEWIHVDDKYFFLEHVVRLMSIIHSIVSLFMLVAYYHLKVRSRSWR